MFHLYNVLNKSPLFSENCSFILSKQGTACLPFNGKINNKNNCFKKNEKIKIGRENFSVVTLEYFFIADVYAVAILISS